MSTQVNNVQIKEQDLKFLVEHVLKDWEYLEQEDVLFVYKDKSPVIKRNTLVISRFLSQDEYDYLFLKFVELY